MTPPAARSRRSLVPAAIAAAAVAAIVLVSAFLPGPLAPRSDGPVLPSRLASYSWFTPMLQDGAMDRALLGYQNGFGIELGDTPQSVLLGDDGSTYRRLGQAESRGIAADQGDPARALLGPWGTEILVAGAGRHGTVELITPFDNSSRTLEIGEGRSAVPVSFGADGRTAVLLTSEREMSPLADVMFRLHGTLTLLDIESGGLRELPQHDDVSAAALSPEGERLVVDSGAGLQLISARDGAVLADGLGAAEGQLDGDAWSPDGERFALLSGAELRVFEAGDPGTDTGDVRERSLTVPGIEWGAVIGWRDDETVLASAGGPGDGARLGWIDIGSGEFRQISAYSPDWTGAGLGTPDAARLLVAEWEVLDRPVDQGPAATLLLLLLAPLAGGLVWRLTPRRPRRDPADPSGSGGPGAEAGGSPEADARPLPVSVS